MPPRLATAADHRALRDLINGKRPPAKADSAPNKFNARKVQTPDFKADSRHEATWLQTLLTMHDGGFIEKPQLDKRQLVYALDVNGVRIRQYIADARFRVLREFELPTLDGVRVVRPGETHVLDAKSPPTRKRESYIMKRNLMFALYGIVILEV